MENTKYNDYDFADITTEDVNNISELENQISSKSSKNIILIAYQPKDGQNK